MPPSQSDDEVFADTKGLEAEPDSAELAAFGSLVEELDPQPPPRLDPGTVLADSFEIEEAIGAGGMGIVYRAHDLRLERPVALKLHRPMARGTERLMREAASMAKLAHPNVATVHEVGTHEGMFFIAMEFIDGVTARDWVIKAERTPAQIMSLYHAAGRGLVAAHDAGIIHRDFKPQNVLVGLDDVPRVVDFGLARSTSDVPLETVSGRSRTLVSSGSLTKTGVVVGTPAYMAPEQFDGEEIDVRADQFSFCVSLYEAAYGERPFAGDSIHELLLSMAKGAIRPAPTRTRVPTRLRRILIRGLSVKPEDRWPSMAVLLEQLERLFMPRGRQWLLPTLAVGILGLGGGLVAGQGTEPVERCADGLRQLASIWDDQRREEAKAAILSTGSSYAKDTWERVEPQLDDYAEAWGTQYTEVCEARSDDAQAEQDRGLRLDCLRSRSRALRATVDQLVRADAEVVEHAVTLVAGLPGFGRCDDLEALRAVVPPPEDPEVRAEVEALQEQLADIYAAEGAGKYGSAFEAVEPVVGRADALGYGPLIAEAKVRRGSLHIVNDRYADAERDLKEGYETAIEHRHDGVAFHAARDLAKVVGGHLARHAEGRIWSGVALAQAKRSGDEGYVAIALQSVGDVLMEQGEYAQAKSYYERALQLDEHRLGPNHVDIAYLLESLGGLLRSQGEYDQAQRYYERALRLREASLGPDHPHVAAVLGNLGNVLTDQGEPHKAGRYHERALRIWETVLGPEHIDVALSLANLGNVLQAQGEYRRAQHNYERAATIMERTLGAEHPTVGAIADSLGTALRAQGEYAQAQRHHERSVRIREAALGPKHPQLAISLHNLGTVLVDQRQHEDAKIHLERALRIWEEELRPDHPNVAATVGLLGRVSLAQGKHDDAQRRLERALKIQQAALGVDHPDVAISLNLLALTALAQEDFEGAQGHAERAVSIRERGDVGPELLARSRFVLARSLWSDPTQRARARALAQQAREVFIQFNDADPHDRSAVAQWLAAHRTE